jgi:hypothetical protein
METQQQQYAAYVARLADQRKTIARRIDLAKKSTPLEMAMRLVITGSAPRRVRGAK